MKLFLTICAIQAIAGFGCTGRRAAPADGSRASVAAAQEEEHEEHFDPIFYYHGVNLLAADNGGRLVKSTGKGWSSAIDGLDDEQTLSKGAEATFGFKGDKPAVFSRFTMLMPESSEANVKVFELLVGDLPNGPFESIGKFDTQNQKATDSGYQEFNFQPATARYLKIRILKTFGAPTSIIHELTLFGAQP